ncbi:hypothetical protein AB0N05_06510 [Nocardia sp. NPDC051030]
MEPFRLTSAIVSVAAIAVSFVALIIISAISGMRAGRRSLAYRAASGGE